MRQERRPQCHRSIPACAGEPWYKVFRGYRREVYPRVCGGTLPSPAILHLPFRVYPRVCGGTRTTPRPFVATDGLSPRVRGNPASTFPTDRAHRSIPACAGEPFRQCQAPRRGAVYPRVCGGTGRSSQSGRDAGGLSPRVRGNRLARAFPAQGLRSIPACAGEPESDFAWDGLHKVYPRVCGGTILATSFITLG